jgi:hypothetical protein
VLVDDSAVLVKDCAVLVDVRSMPVDVPSPLLRERASLNDQRAPWGGTVLLNFICFQG